MVTLHIPDIDPGDRIFTAEILREVALLMYQKGRWSLGKAAHFAGIPYVVFQQILGDRGIYMNYDEEAFLSDIQTINERLT